MNQTERCLLQAIWDDIDDDDARLVYADFLEEKGDPRGEFIRLQVARDRAGSHNASAREQALLDRHFDEWARAAQPFDASKVRLIFERGFIAIANIKHGT